jgi:hypothetical protein
MVVRSPGFVVRTNLGQLENSLPFQRQEWSSILANERLPRYERVCSVTCSYRINGPHRFSVISALMKDGSPKTNVPSERGTNANIPTPNDANTPTSQLPNANESLPISHISRTMPRSFQYLHGYAVVGVAFVGSMLKDAYDRATDVCEMFPQFEFLPTFLEEILLHHTRLPLLSLPVSTVLVIAALLAGFVATYFRVIEWLWLFLIDFFSGRWIYNLLFVHIPAWYGKRRLVVGGRSSRRLSLCWLTL